MMKLFAFGFMAVIVKCLEIHQQKVLSKDARQAENKINAIFKALVTNKPIRISTINNKKMRIVEAQQPFFVEKDTQQRFVWVFNITVTAF